MKKDIEELVKEGEKLYSSLMENEKEEVRQFYFRTNYEGWYSKALAVIKTLLPDRLDDFVMQYKPGNRKTIDASTYTISDALRGVSHVRGTFDTTCAAICLLRQVKMIGACLDVFESRIYEIQVILQADIFDSEMESAKHLLKRGYLRAAGAICGVVIERHLSMVCIRRGLQTKKKNPSIAEYNDTLKDNAYDTIEWRRMQHLADIRNLCDHSKDREPSKEEVEELIAGTERVIKVIF